jgi:hypothetical protein
MNRSVASRGSAAALVHGWDIRHGDIVLSQVEIVTAYMWAFIHWTTQMVGRGREAIQMASIVLLGQRPTISEMGILFKAPYWDQLSYSASQMGQAVSYCFQRS